MSPAELIDILRRLPDTAEMLVDNGGVTVLLDRLDFLPGDGGYLVFRGANRTTPGTGPAPEVVMRGRFPAAKPSEPPSREEVIAGLVDVLTT